MPINLYPGSATEIGTVYQNIPSRPDIPFHRDRSDWRAERICELVNIKGKVFLDLGCSVGTMSSGFMINGAAAGCGVDHDAGAIALAKETHRNIFPLSFCCEDINRKWLDSISSYDVIIWTSQFMWMVKQHGMEYALDFLFELSKKCQVLVFETAGRNDGSAPLAMDQEDILPMLIKNTCFQKITDHGPWNDNWSPRNVFVCEQPKMHWESHLSTVERMDRHSIRKTYDVKSERALEICAREIEFLNRFKGHAHFPEVIGSAVGIIEMVYAGLPAVWIPEQDARYILQTLKAKGITHRDIQPSNLMWDGEKCTLIDFAYAVNVGDVTNYHYDLGGKYKCPHGFNDEYSLRKVQSELICK